MTITILSNRVRALMAVGIAAALAACSGASGVAPSAGGANSPTAPVAANHAKGKLTLRIHIPKKVHDRGIARHGKPAYVSPATQGMTIDITGPTDVSETIALTPTASGCNSSLSGVFCTLTIPGLAPCVDGGNCYTATLATYDAITGCPSGCTIPASANELSGDQNVPFTITVGQANAINLTLDGIPTSVEFVPGKSASLTGNQADGYLLSKCATAAQNVSVFGADADHNYILGAGAPTVSLTSDSAKLTVAARVKTPNGFALTPNNPTPKLTVHLTAAVTPGANSGASVISAQIDVNFSGICGTITEYAQGGWLEAGTRDVTMVGQNAVAANYLATMIGQIANGTFTDLADSYGTGLYQPALTSGGHIGGITTAADGSIWFTEEDANKIGQITPAGTVIEFSGLTANAAPEGITVGPDGALWFAESGLNQIGRITTDGSTVNEYTGLTGGASKNSRPREIVSGPDGALWFTEYNADAIGRITTTGSVSNQYALANNSAPYYITSGPDGALWFTENLGNAIGRITTGGSITTASTPSSVSSPTGITTGPDGALYFGGLKGIGRVTTTMHFSSYTTGFQDSTAGVTGITTSPDGSLWFAEYNASNIGRLQ